MGEQVGQVFFKWVGERERLFIHGYGWAYSWVQKWSPDTRELMLRPLGVATMYGWILGLFIMYNLRSKKQKTEAKYKLREFIFGSDIVMK